MDGNMDKPRFLWLKSCNVLLHFRDPFLDLVRDENLGIAVEIIKNDDILGLGDDLFHFIGDHMVESVQFLLRIHSSLFMFNSDQRIFQPTTAALFITGNYPRHPQADSGCNLVSLGHLDRPV